MLASILLVVHLMIAAGLVGVVLLQRSEGGALGIGGGGGGGSFLTGRGTANLLTRVTAGLAGAFFLTSLLLTILAQSNNTATPVVGRDQPSQTQPAVPAVPGTPAPPASGDNTPAGTQPRGGIFDRLQTTPAAPVPPPSK
jgi:preprotein translocase subunit SecG